VDERASACPMPPQPIKAIWILSLADVFTGLGVAPSKGTLSAAPAAAVVKNSRREVTLYFLSDEEVDGVGLGLELVLDEVELSEEDVLLPLESDDELADSFLSDLSEEEPSPSFLLPPSFFPGLELPLLA